MIKPYRDCFTTSVVEKLKWFKHCLWDGELPRGASLALQKLLHGCLEEDIRSQIGVGRHERGVEILELICGVSVSAATVSQVCKALDEHVRAYQQRPLQDRYQYLLLDGIHLRCKGAEGPKCRVVLVAYGFAATGKRELIAFRQVPGEGEQHCSAFLEDVRRRGISATICG